MFQQLLKTYFVVFPACVVKKIVKVHARNCECCEGLLHVKSHKALNMGHCSHVDGSIFTYVYSLCHVFSKWFGIYSSQSTTIA